MNFDLSKIYSEQVNKQKIYLNPYITESRKACTPKSIEGVSEDASAIVQDLLVKFYPDYFSPHGNCTRIFKNKEISPQQFFENFVTTLIEYSGGLIESIGNPNYIDAGASYSGGVLSGDLDHVIFDISYYPLKGNKVQKHDLIDKTDSNTFKELPRADQATTAVVAIGLAGKLETSFGTPVKENLPGLLFNLKSEAFLKNDDDVLNFFKTVMPNGSFEQNAFGTIPGQAITQCAISLNAFKSKMESTKLTGNKKVKLPAAQRGMINGSLSIPKALAAAGFTPEKFVYMSGADNLPNEPHGVLKNKGSVLSGKLSDEWCPADIFVVPKWIYELEGGFNAWLDKQLDSVPEGGDGSAELTHLNSLFAKEFKHTSVDQTTPILALSLKQESGRGGKAKNYIRQRLLNPTPGDEKDALPPVCDVNMTPEEINPTGTNPEENGAQGSNRDFWIRGIDAFLQNISLWVNANSEHIKFSTANPAFSFSSINPETLGNNKTAPDQYLFAKYGALKALDCILSAGGGPGIFVDILRAGRKIDDAAPSFFKMVENTKGQPANVEPQHKLQVSINYPIEIAQIYNPTYKGLEIILDTTENSGASYSKRKIWKIVMTTQKTNAQQIEIETAPGKTL
jgi:hypothetical protein